MTPLWQKWLIGITIAVLAISILIIGVNTWGLWLR